MSKFEPNSTIYFCRTGIDDSNKPYFDPTGSADNQIVTWMLNGGARVATCTNYSFQRTDGRYRIAVDSDDCDYDTLLNCDTIAYKNQGVTENAIWVVGNIVAVEWINPNNTYVYYTVDYYCTYSNLIDWNDSVCYVEREHVKEDWVQNGVECPAFSNMGPPETFTYEPDTPVYYSNINFLPRTSLPKAVVYTPYGSSGEKPDFSSKVAWSNIVSGLTPLELEADAVGDYLQKVAESEEADLDRIPLIHTLPRIADNSTPNTFNFTIPMPWAYEDAEISVSNERVEADYHTNVNHIKYRNAKCWSSQFCKLRLVAYNGDSQDYNPQWFGNGRKDTTCEIFSCRTEGGISIILGLKPSNIPMSPRGMGDFMVNIEEPPMAPWVGNMFAQWSTVNGDAMMGRTLAGVTRLLTSIGGGASKLMEGVSSVKPETSLGGVMDLIGGVGNAAATFGNISSTFKEAKTSGAVIGGGFNHNANSAAAQGIYGAQLSALVVQPYIMNSIDDFFDIYGYNVNKVKVPERNTRKFWNFVKTHNAHIGGKLVSYTARVAIENMLNSGVTFWNGVNVSPEGSGGAVCIGDYSLENREENRAIGG